MIEAFQEQLITIDEPPCPHAHLRARETNLRDQIDALDTQAADRELYLSLAAAVAPPDFSCPDPSKAATRS